MKSIIALTLLLLLGIGSGIFLHGGANAIGNIFRLPELLAKLFQKLFQKNTDN